MQLQHTRREGIYHALSYLYQTIYQLFPVAQYSTAWAIKY